MLGGTVGVARQRDRAVRPRRGELDHAESLAGAVVDVDASVDCGVRMLRPNVDANLIAGAPVGSHRIQVARRQTGGRACID
jgi:hypothetical protein